MDLGLAECVAVVAASSQGLGRATAEMFAREGARVVVNGRREDVLRSTAEEIAHATGAEVEAVPGDVSRPADCKRLVEGAIARFGRIDALVTNAGGPPSRPFEHLTDEDWESAFHLTVMSAVRLIRDALPYLRETKGSIVNISSIAAKQPVPGLTLSNTLRTSVLGLAKSLAEDLASDGVRVNNVGSGQIWTSRQKYLAGVRARSLGISIEEAVERNAATIPLGRYGKPEELAGMIVFMCSRHAGFITGQTILVDGGQYKGLM